MSVLRVLYVGQACDVANAVLSNDNSRWFIHSFQSRRANHDHLTNRVRQENK